VVVVVGNIPSSGEIALQNHVDEVFRLGVGLDAELL
jgi:hypothetical protein